MYDELVAALMEIEGVKFAEYEWKTRPTCDYGSVQLDFEAEDDNGDDYKLDRAWEGSVDLFTHGKNLLAVAAVERALSEICGASWYLNSEQHERETGLVHREYVFQLEER